MFALILLAFSCLAVSAFMFFGAPYLLLGRAGLKYVCGRPEARALGGALSLMFAMAAIIPLSQTALTSSGDIAYEFAATLTNMSFGA